MNGKEIKTYANSFSCVIWQSLYVIMIRSGPFCHAEIRNGGMRSGYSAVRLRFAPMMKVIWRMCGGWTQKLAYRSQGLLYKEGGPIIGTQIENEHNHLSAQWGQTTGINNMWLNGGSNGNEDMLRLRNMATRHV
ncbi:beta-galactosidase [Paenibacillus donghaensis]|uniref:beta-galactosidase n=1 Tax=Paenibacillus donghaensis TaxID=414771 RepID=UPI00147115BC|nr:beta-galactosidase [Paenibacillus donghaensis]